MKKKYLIIGNGVGAVGCIEGIREKDQTAKITVLSGEDHPVYGRPLISYYLQGKTDLARMAYRGADFYEKNGCEVRYGVRATSLDAERKTVTTDAGDTIEYDAVCVATGSSPFVPPFEGLEKVKNKFGFMTLDDTLALEKALFPEARVLIVGAGLIGLKCAEGIAARVGSITVCDLAPRVLSSILDDACAAPVQKHLEERGICFLLGDSAVKFDEKRAYMKSGAEVPFDILVLAVGVRANTALVKDAGGDCGRGIAVDEKMRTTLPSVFAAGDCTEGYDITAGVRRVLAILPNAYMQGKTAGLNMAGGKAVFDRAMPMNSIGFFGLHLMTAGVYPGADEGGEVYEEKGEGTLKRLYKKGDALVGFILIGDVGRAGIYTALIRNRTPLSSVSYDLLKQSPTLAAFSGAERGRVLGGKV